LGSLSHIVSEFVPLLNSVGLHINESKTEILIRPSDSSLTSLLIGGLNVRVVSTLRYLGTFLTADLKRCETIRTRCRQASSVVHMLTRFIREHTLPFTIVIQMYKQLVVPLMTYGLRAAVLTKANRLRLARYEKHFLIQLLKFSSNRPQRICVRRILNGKTINRKVTVYRTCYWGHVLRRSRSHLLNSAWRYTRHYRKVGRPIFTWHDSIERDIQNIPVPRDVLEMAAQSGKLTLKREVEKLYDSDRESSNETDDYFYDRDSN